MTLVAMFEQNGRTLSVVGSGLGSGTVTGPGINCSIRSGVRSGDCSETFAPTDTPQLEARPAAASTFLGWSGACSGAARCNLTMHESRSVTASFGVGEM